MPNESELHRAIFDRSRDLMHRFPHVLLGPGDDCAAIRPDGSRPMLITTDQLIEGRHFAPHPQTSIDLIARKAIARSVSDIAAMGGTSGAPGGAGGWGVATGLLPHDWPRADELCERLAYWADHFGFPLVGGDIATHSKGEPNPLLVLTTTLAAPAHAVRGPVTRSGAQVGDEVFVTGRIGNSFASGRHLTFEPRIGEAAALCDLLGPSLRAMIDVSDGLGRDAARLAQASGVRIELDLGAIPLHSDMGHEPLDPRRAAAHGEDYELLFTVGGCVDCGRIPSSIHGNAGATAITLIGRVVEAQPGKPRCVGIDATGGGGSDEEIDLTSAGWDH